MAAAATTTVSIEMNQARVTLPGGRVVQYKWPVALQQILSEPEMRNGAAGSSDTNPIVAALVNGVVTSLSCDLPARVATVAPVLLDTAEGLSIYRRSLVFVLGMAAWRQFGGSFHVTVEHSLNPSSYMCAVDGGRTVTRDEVAQLKAQMRRIIDADMPIVEQGLSYGEAVEHFEATGRTFSRACVVTGNADVTRVAACDGYAALWYRALIHRTGALSIFDLWWPSDGLGFALLFPSSQRKAEGLPCKKEEIEDSVITGIYREYNAWGRLLKVGNAGELNELVLRGESRRFVAISEALQNHKIVEIALAMQPRLGSNLRIVLIAGPSASGKTTFAGKLGIQLQILGCVPVVLSVDNYFRPRHETPKDESGEYDFENLDALRVEYLNDHLLRLLNGEVVNTPIFDFHTGMPKKETIRMQLPPNGVLIMEGIHMLNPKLTHLVPDSVKFKIFIAPLSQLNLDELNFTSHAVGRLIRRVVRDFRTRGYSARDTLARWDSVSRGEERNIFPFMRSADIIFNTALDYETSVLKTFVSPLLRSVTPAMEQYNLARNLLFILDAFFSIPHDDVPANSLLREFIGGSFFESD
jgi:uridine kinase